MPAFATRNLADRELSAPQTHADICDNLVPIEIAMRCARAVIEGKPFAAYIIIPMWPEGGSLSPLH